MLQGARASFSLETTWRPTQNLFFGIDISYLEVAREGWRALLTVALRKAYGPSDWGKLNAMDGGPLFKRCR